MHNDIEEEWRPVFYYGKIHPWYSISNYGNCVSHFRMGNNGRYIVDPNQRKIVKKANMKCLPSVEFHIHFPSDFFIGTTLEGIDYSSKIRGLIRKHIYAHQLVMSTFKPIDLYPPDRLRDCWDVIPELAKQWIRETVTINHIDHDPRNNTVWNLEYVTQGENTRKAVEFYDGYLNLKKEILINKPVFTQKKEIIIRNALTEVLGL